ncbi:GIY-YIG nuclease family protein [Thermodesulfovibrionales bacterium]|nr:GIY-YIG nuclease family protein [Thermodesulfovibrionales bacterium]
MNPVSLRAKRSNLVFFCIDCHVANAPRNDTGFTEYLPSGFPARHCEEASIFPTRHCEEAKPTKQSQAQTRNRLRNLKEFLFVEKSGYIYIMTNKNNTVLYTGVTSNLLKRVYEHRQKLVEGFTKKYNLNKLVYYETFDEIMNAIIREKQIKGGSRAKKLKLIKGFNPEFRDLFDEIASG